MTQVLHVFSRIIIINHHNPSSQQVNAGTVERSDALIARLISERVLVIRSRRVFYVLKMYQMLSELLVKCGVENM